MGFMSKFFSKKDKAEAPAFVFAGTDEDRRVLLLRGLGPNPKPALGSSLQRNITQELVHVKLLDADYARAVTMDAKARGTTVASILSEQGAVPKEKITAAIEACDVSMLATGLDYDVRMPRRILRDYKIVIHGQTENKIMISSLSNVNLVMQALAPFTNDREIVFIPFSFEKWAEFEQHINRIFEPDTGTKVKAEFNATSIVSDSADDASVLDLIVDFAAHQGVSDIHIEPTKLIYNVFFRNLGKRVLVHCGKIDQYNRLCAMVKDRARVDPMETRIPQDGSFSVQIRGRGYDIRVATVPVDGKEKITMRLLDPEKAQMKLTQLGISGVEVWRSICRYRNGLVLIVGSTGSGKTTTLNATVREMQRFEKSIYTAEDPVEYRIPFVTHVQINDAVGLSFARAIKAFMRADPDVIILGEIRDNETATKAIQAAETGHLVLATIHAESVPMALKRLNGLSVKPSDYDMLLRGILVQFLVRTLCKKCNGAGCEACFDAGYAGRQVVSEIARIRNPSDVERISRGEVFWEPLWQDLERKLLDGVTDGREIYRCFPSEMEDFAEHSEPLRIAYQEQVALRVPEPAAEAPPALTTPSPDDLALAAHARNRLAALGLPLAEGVAAVEAPGPDLVIDRDAPDHDQVDDTLRSAEMAAEAALGLAGRAEPESRSGPDVIIEPED